MDQAEEQRPDPPPLTLDDVLALYWRRLPRYGGDPILTVGDEPEAALDSCLRLLETAARRDGPALRGLVVGASGGSLLVALVPEPADAARAIAALQAHASETDPHHWGLCAGMRAIMTEAFASEPAPLRDFLGRLGPTPFPLAWFGAEDHLALEEAISESFEDPEIGAPVIEVARSCSPLFAAGGAVPRCASGGGLLRWFFDGARGSYRVYLRPEPALARAAAEALGAAAATDQERGLAASAGRVAALLRESGAA